MSEVTIQPTDCIWMGTSDDLPDGDGYKVGWMFFSWGWNLSDHYKNNVAQVRQPISVICPTMLHWEDGSYPDRLSGTPFCIDSYPTPDDDKPVNTAAHWDLTVDLSTLVVGKKPMITVNPSIHLIGTWHGWLQNGILHN